MHSAYKLNNVETRGQFIESLSLASRAIKSNLNRYLYCATAFTFFFCLSLSLQAQAFRNRLPSKRPLPLFIFRFVEHITKTFLSLEKRGEQSDDGEPICLSLSQEWSTTFPSFCLCSLHLLISPINSHLHNCFDSNVNTLLKSPEYYFL